jgi:hypothetical protein
MTDTIDVRRLQSGTLKLEVIPTVKQRVALQRELLGRRCSSSSTTLHALE